MWGSGSLGTLADQLYVVVFCGKLLTIMGRYCIVWGCSNTNKNGVSLFQFPKEMKLRKVWTTQVKKTRAKWKGDQLPIQLFVVSTLLLTALISLQQQLKNLVSKCSRGSEQRQFSPSFHDLTYLLGYLLSELIRVQCAGGTKGLVFLDFYAATLIDLLKRML